MNTTLGIAHVGIDMNERIDKIKAILTRGNVVCFTGGNGIKKYVTEWNEDSDGDLTADYSTGQSKFVCPVALAYVISEITAEEYTKLRTK